MNISRTTSSVSSCVLDVVPGHCGHVPYIVRIETHGASFTNRHEHRHSAFAGHVELPFRRVWMPVQISHASGFDSQHGSRDVLCGGEIPGVDNARVAAGRVNCGLHRPHREGVPDGRLNFHSSYGCAIFCQRLGQVRRENKERAGGQLRESRLVEIRYTGLQAYSVMEGYERMKAGMRLYRAVDNPQQSRGNLASTLAAISPLFSDTAQVKRMLANDIAFYMGWVGHYVADAAQPLHNSMHHDGWSGANPKGYTRDPEIHGRFESRYVDLIETTSPDVAKYMRKDARHLDDVWKATLDHSIEARNSVEDVYRADLRGAFQKKDDTEARELVYKRLAAGASFLRDLTYTAGIESAKPLPRIDPINRMENPENPRYNPAAGSAPAQ